MHLLYEGSCPVVYFSHYRSLMFVHTASLLLLLLQAPPPPVLPLLSSPLLFTPPHPVPSARLMQLRGGVRLFFIKLDVTPPPSEHFFLSSALHLWEFALISRYISFLSFLLVARFILTIYIYYLYYLKCFIVFWVASSLGNTPIHSFWFCSY